MREMGVTKDRLKLRIGVLGAEPWSENMRAQIEEQMGIDAIDIYGLSEVIGPGVSCECIEAKNGPHIFMDHFLPEIINPDTGEVLKPGEKGELVFTTLTKEAFPLIRYRTRDISILNDEPCKCGRVMWRMQRVTGRSDDMLIIRGVNVFPSQIESVILRHPEVEPHYIIEVDRKDALDVLTVKVEVSEKAFSDEIKKLEQIEKRLEHDIKDFLGVTAKVQLVEPRSIKRSEGKAQRVIDRRKI
jgi:phenylacetate-CoA ligase